MKRTAVVTGANGFIGERVVKGLLDRGYFVYAITNEKDSLKHLHCDSLIVISLLFEEYDEMLYLVHEKNVDCFIHCAWQGVWGKAFEDYDLQMKNAVFAGKTFEIAERLKTRKFVLLSTVNVLETKKFIINPLSFNNLRATTNYGIAKITAETICRVLSCKSKTVFNCAYLSMVFGEGNRSMMVPNVVISKLLKGESPDLIKGDGLYDLIYVEDVASGLIAIAEKGLPNKSYYLGSRRLKTFKEIFLEIGQIINPDVEMNFGVYPDNNFIDYSLINLDELYDDTGYEIKGCFKRNVVETAKWIKENLL